MSERENSVLFARVLPDIYNSSSHILMSLILYYGIVKQISWHILSYFILFIQSQPI